MYNSPQRIIKLKRYKVTAQSIYKMTKEQKIRWCDTTRLKNKMRILTENKNKIQK